MSYSCSHIWSISSLVGVPKNRQNRTPHTVFTSQITSYSNNWWTSFPVVHIDEGGNKIIPTISYDLNISNTVSNTALALVYFTQYLIMILQYCSYVFVKSISVITVTNHTWCCFAYRLMQITMYLHIPWHARLTSVYHSVLYQWHCHRLATHLHVHWAQLCITYSTVAWCQRHGIGILIGWEQGLLSIVNSIALCP